MRFQEMDDAGVGVPPRALVVVYCVFWSFVTNLGSLAYCAYLLLWHYPAMRLVALNSFMISASSMSQAISGFYYLQKYLMIGVRLGWLQLVSTERVARAPRKSLFVWFVSTLALFCCLLSQVVILSRDKSPPHTPVILGYLLAGFNFVSFLGIIFGLVISGLFKTQSVEGEQTTELDDMTGSTSRRQSDAVASPRRRNNRNGRTPIGAQLP